MNRNKITNKYSSIICSFVVKMNADEWVFAHEINTQLLVDTYAKAK